MNIQQSLEIGDVVTICSDLHVIEKILFTSTKAGYESDGLIAGVIATSMAEGEERGALVCPIRFVSAKHKRKKR